jgi:hypothetical protein
MRNKIPENAMTRRDAILAGSGLVLDIAAGGNARYSGRA